MADKPKLIAKGWDKGRRGKSQTAKDKRRDRERYDETEADREQAAYDEYRYGGATDA
jgi:hypothetical protein